jgi:hypothetical protein
MNEQRRAARVPVDLPARARLGDIAIEGRAIDLSQGGVFVKAHPNDLDRHALDVSVEIDFPDVEWPLIVTGEVRWVDLDPERSGFGIRFHPMEVQARRLLANFVLRRTAQL